MERKNIGFDVLKVAEQVLGYKKREQNAVVTLKDGSRMTTTLYIYTTPEGKILVNYSRTNNTLVFDTEAEFNAYAAKKWEMFKSEKEMYMTFTGMDEDTWNAWNGNSEEE